MGVTFQRKDQTSIFCPQHISTKTTFTTKTRSLGLIIAFSLMAIGIWIVINFR